MSLTALYDVPAPAKVNLFLHVVGRRPDGYHLLQSAFMLVDWCDVLHFERRSDGRIARSDLGPALPEDDLCLRAAKALQSASGTKLGAHIAIDKRVPWGAGLGGGSSDAASTLLALNRLWALDWPRTALLDLALKLGADVPFFIGGCNAWVQGIGEVLDPITLPPVALAIVKPSSTVPTAAIFGSPDLPRNTPAAIVADFLADPFGFGRNDLQAVASAYAASAHAASTQCSSPLTMRAGAHGTPKGEGDSLGGRSESRGTGDIAAALRLLAQAYGSSRMTGSGSAVFACAGVDAGARDQTDKLARVMATAPHDWSGRLCQGLEQHPLRGWARD